MTAKEMLNKVKCNTHEMIDINESELRDLMNEYARHIAEKAVEDERNTYRGEHYPGMEGNNLMNRILSRIKTLTQTP